MRLGVSVSGLRWEAVSRPATKGCEFYQPLELSSPGEYHGCTLQRYSQSNILSILCTRLWCRALPQSASIPTGSIHCCVVSEHGQPRHGADIGEEEETAAVILRDDIVKKIARVNYASGDSYRLKKNLRFA